MFTCWIYKRFLGEYLEEGLSGYLQTVVRQHVSRCAFCQDELERLQDVGTLLRHLPSPAVPADLAFQVRCRLSQERGRRQRPGWQWRWANVAAPFAVPVAAGALSTLLLFAILLPMFGTPVRADSRDVPLTIWTPPRLRSSGPIRFDSQMDGLVVRLLIDQEGRVVDGNLMVDTGRTNTPDEVRTVQNLLLFAVFDPATFFGRPTADTVVVPLGTLRPQS